MADGGEALWRKRRREDAGTEGLPPGDGQKKPIGFKALKRERQKIMEQHFGYTNENNPFGDSSLAEPFIWKKKNAYLKAAGKLTLPTPSLLIQEAQRKVSEIESVKKRREERELEEKLLQEQRDLLEREREQENYEEWESKEEYFHVQQALAKSQIRLEQGRAKTVDLLVKAIGVVEGKSYPDLTLLKASPPDFISRLPKEDVEELIRDIRMHIRSCGRAQDSPAAKYFRSVLTIAEDSLKHLNTGRVATGTERDSDTGIPISVMDDIEQVFLGKTKAELEVLEFQVNRKLSHADETVDPTYWETIQSKLPLFKARAEVVAVHDKAKDIVRQKTDASAQQSGQLAKKEQKGRHVTDNLLGEDYGEESGSVERGKEADEYEEEGDGSYSPELEPYDADAANSLIRGPYSPLLVSYEDFAKLVVVKNPQQSSVQLLDPLEERQKRRQLRVELERKVRAVRQQTALTSTPGQGLRRGVSATSTTTTTSTSSMAGVTPPVIGENGLPLNEDDPNMVSAKSMTYDEFVRREKKEMAADEEVMAASAEIVSPNIKRHYEWEDKYRPRKPRFFNRVKTGYEWNKYNQTHYDHDNPPPKTVQGYKFNVFYPDLIDKTKTPTWSITRCSDDEDRSKDGGPDPTVILSFHAGPPYEDLAFKIINREWCLERFRGFRNVFEKGILQLYFSFKRFRYRR